MMDISRRDFMRYGVAGAAAFAASLLVASCGKKAESPGESPAPAMPKKTGAGVPPAPGAAAPGAAKTEEIHRVVDANKMTELESKHVPQFALPVELKSGKQIDVTINIGKVPHPMEATHYIEWAELYLDDKLVKKIELKPGDKPQAVFQITPGARKQMKAHIMCNKHGLWEAVMDITGTK